MTRDAIKRFNAHGIAGLFDKPRTGRPSLLDAEQDAQIKAVVLEGPDIEGDGLSAFTLDDVRGLIIEKFNVAYHLNSMSGVMRRLDLTRQKARPSHPEKDPAAEAVFKKRPTRHAENCRYISQAK